MASANIAKVTKYLPLIDKVYKQASLTALLDTTNGVDFVGAEKIKYAQTSVDGLKDYSRDNGYDSGAVTVAWKEFDLTQDRGRKFMVDVMDDEESLGIAFGTLAGEFMRTKVVPELDLYRFSQYATNATVNNATATLNTTNKVKDAIDTAEYELAEDEIDLNGAILFMSNKAYKLLKGEINRETQYNAQGVAFDVETYDGMRIVRCPASRLAFASKDSSTGAWEKDTTKGDINFIIIKPEAICQVVKHEVPKVISPEANQTADAWMYFYRIYHDAFAFDNKKGAIYLHKEADPTQSA